jgi:type II secretory pathway pseudopilin PulG
VLGLIAALTLPTIFNSVNEQRKKAIFKEAIQSLSEATYKASMEGDTTTGLAFFEKSLNCARVSSTLTISGALDAADSMGCILPNGAIISNLNQALTQETFWIDWNGNEAPNARGQDRLGLGVNWGANPTTNLTTQGIPTLRPGEIKPFTHSHWGGQDNVDLFNSLYQ